MTADEADARAAQAARAEAAYRQLFVAIASAAPHSRVEQRAGLLLVGPGRALPRYNTAFLIEPPADPAATLAQAQAFFRTVSAGWMLKASGATAAAVDRAARSAGMTHEVEPGMVLAGPPAPAAADPSLRIVPVEDTGALWTFDQTMQAGFGNLVPIAVPEVMDSGALLRVPGLSFFLGMVDGEPVGTATLFVHDRVACIADISVAPSMRRRGFGGALTAHAIGQGRARGCEIAYLEASAMGEPVYRRLGFRAALEAHGWLARPGS